MKVDVTCNLPCELAQARKVVKTLSLLNYVSAPIMHFERVESYDSKAPMDARPLFASLSR